VPVGRARLRVASAVALRPKRDTSRRYGAASFACIMSEGWPGALDPDPSSWIRFRLIRRHSAFAPSAKRVALRRDLAAALAEAGRSFEEFSVSGAAARAEREAARRARVTALSCGERAMRVEPRRLGVGPQAH
jgi:hypothetical protein